MRDQNQPASLPTEFITAAGWLQHQGLALPLWLMLEGVRPLAWIMGQAIIVGEPLTRGTGIHRVTCATLALMQDPIALAQFTDLLAPPHSRSRNERY